MNNLELGKIYRHFKGNYYLVLDTALHSETREEYVVYKSLYGKSKTYIRPLEMFLDDIDSNRPGNVTGQTHRFKLDTSINKDYTV